MFIHAAQFNGDISTWDVSNVTNMNVSSSLAKYFTQQFKLFTSLWHCLLLTFLFLFRQC